MTDQEHTPCNTCGSTGHILTADGDCYQCLSDSVQDMLLRRMESVIENYSAAEKHPITTANERPGLLEDIEALREGLTRHSNKAYDRAVEVKRLLEENRKLRDLLDAAELVLKSTRLKGPVALACEINRTLAQAEGEPK